jgi:uncharacterized protein (TIGR03083 family)
VATGEANGGAAGANRGPLLAECWRGWAARARELTAQEWATPTRCPPWDVKALTAHVVPDLGLMTALPGMVLDTPAAVDDPAVLLRGFNAGPSALAHTMADTLVQLAVARAAASTPEDLALGFEAGADFVGDAPLGPDAVVPHPVVGSVTVGVITDVAVLEATIHLLDVVAAVGGEGPPPDALEFVGALLARLPDPVAFIEAATGRGATTGVLPVLR